MHSLSPYSEMHWETSCPWVHMHRYLDTYLNAFEGHLQNEVEHT